MRHEMDPVFFAPSSIIPHPFSLLPSKMPTLLVVDDEPSILTAFRRAFRSPLQVLTAETAREGLELARQHHPDVIILDVQLPDMSGLDALGRLRALDARSPVISITG